MQRLIISLVLTSILTSCGEYKYEVRYSSGYDIGQIVHVVLLDLRPEITSIQMDSVVHALEQLAEIDGVEGFLIGEPFASQDPRAIEDYDISITMAFDSESEMEFYENHPEHAQVRDIIKPYLAGPPKVVDQLIVPLEAENEN